MVMIFPSHTPGEQSNHIIINCLISKTEYLAGGGSEMTVEYNWDALILTLPGGSYTGVSLASVIQDILNNFAVKFLFGVVYHGARGTITIQANSEGMDSNNKIIIPSDFAVQT